MKKQCVWKKLLCCVESSVHFCSTDIQCSLSFPNGSNSYNMCMLSSHCLFTLHFYPCITPMFLSRKEELNEPTVVGKKIKLWRKLLFSNYFLKNMIYGMGENSVKIVLLSIWLHPANFFIQSRDQFLFFTTATVLSMQVPWSPAVALLVVKEDSFLPISQWKKLVGSNPLYHSLLQRLGVIFHGKIISAVSLHLYESQPIFGSDSHVSVPVVHLLV